MQASPTNEKGHNTVYATTAHDDTQQTGLSRTYPRQQQVKLG